MKTSNVGHCDLDFRRDLPSLSGQRNRSSEPSRRASHRRITHGQPEPGSDTGRPKFRRNPRNLLRDLRRATFVRPRLAARDLLGTSVRKLDRFSLITQQISSSAPRWTKKRREEDGPLREDGAKKTLSLPSADVWTPVTASAGSRQDSWPEPAHSHSLEAWAVCADGRTQRRRA